MVRLQPSKLAMRVRFPLHATSYSKSRTYSEEDPAKNVRSERLVGTRSRLFVIVFGSDYLKIKSGGGFIRTVGSSNFALRYAPCDPKSCELWRLNQKSLAFSWQIPSSRT
jgi:hypothetical protein